MALSLVSPNLEHRMLYDLNDLLADVVFPEYLREILDADLLVLILEFVLVNGAQDLEHETAVV